MCHTQHVLLGDQDLGKLRNLVLSHNNINGFNCKNNALIAFRPYMPCSSMHVAGLEILCYTQISFTPVAKSVHSTGIYICVLNVVLRPNRLWRATLNMSLKQNKIKKLHLAAGNPMM